MDDISHFYLSENGIIDKIEDNNSRTLSEIFEKYNLGTIELKKRVVMAPLTRSRAEKNIPNELMAKYYQQRASAGLIISEGTSPSLNGLGYPSIPGAYSNEQIAGWKKVADAVHSVGGKFLFNLCILAEFQQKLIYQKEVLHLRHQLFLLLVK